MESVLQVRMNEAVDNFVNGIISEAQYKNVLETIKFSEYSSVFKCCHNCGHWMVDYSLCGKYEYNNCDAILTKPKMTQCAAWCGLYSGIKTLGCPLHKLPETVETT